ncbi:hypothetical protein HanPSC8_Chr03g0087881 [Helianthus annuus]|nr:hypothetical protein HanLR1_Chr03g0080791 [Helianthus annuus]KAJ0942101.1 hypothetical protein HanPSC8_Chr03g0087881 [Helianthus annuus]
MAPKEQKRKPATKKTDKTEEQIISEPLHNMVTYLDPEGKMTEFNEITRWLRKSKINEAITHQTAVYKTLVKEFWDSANVIEVDGKEVIRGQVNHQNVDVSVDILNTVLQLNDNLDALYSIPIMCQRGCLLRMKCTNDIFGGKINKTMLPMRYKFLLHILIQCGEGGDGGNVGASGAGARSGDDAESHSEDNPPEPGYEHYIDERGIRQVRRIRTDQDEDYMPSDTEAERRKKKQTAIRRKKKMKKTIGTSSSEPVTVQQETVAEPVHEAEVNPVFALTAEETTAMMTSPSVESQPPPTTTSSTETPVVTPPPEQQPGASSSQQQRSTAHQRSSEHRGRMFSEMAPDEKVNFLFSQLQAAAEQISRHSEFMVANRNTVITQQMEINKLKETVSKQQVEIIQLHAENESLKAADDERARQLLQM